MTIIPVANQIGSSFRVVCGTVSCLKKNRSWADLNHRSPVYETGALTAKPQDLKTNGRLGLTVAIFANPFTEFFFVVIVSYTVWGSKGRFGDL